MTKMPAVRSRRKPGSRRTRKTSPSPFTPPWTPRPAQFGHGIHHNVGVTTTSEALWVAHLDDVAPDGASRPLTQGALLGSHRVLDPDRTWYLPDGTVLRPHHFSTRSAVKPVVPGELTRYDVEVFPTAALLEPGHRLRLTVTTYDFPHLVPTKPARRALAGGSYRLHQGRPTPSQLLIPVADPDSFG